MTRTERTYYLDFGLYTQWGWFMAPVYPLFLLGLTGYTATSRQAVLRTGERYPANARRSPFSASINKAGQVLAPPVCPDPG